MINPSDFQSIIDFFNQPFIPVIIISIAIVGLCLQFYLNFFRIRRKKQLCYYVSRLNRNSQKENVRFIFQENLVSEVNFVYVYLWNTGWETIDTKDIARKSPIRLISQNRQIRIDDIEIFQTSNPSNDFNLKYGDDDSYTIDFDYINPKQGVVLRIINTQSEIKELRDVFKIIGSIKGFQDPILTSLPPYPLFPLLKGKTRVKSFLILISLIVVTIFGIGSLILDSQTISLFIVISALINCLPQLYAFFFQGRLPIEFEMIETIESKKLKIIREMR